MTSNINEPFVAERVNGKIVNFPSGGYLHYFRNRRKRRAKENTSGATIQRIWKYDIIHHKPILVKTIFHYNN